MVEKLENKSHISLYQEGGARKRTTRKSSKKGSRKTSRKTSRRSHKRSLPAALVEYRKLSDKVLKAINALPNLPENIRDGAVMKKTIGKLLRDNNRDVDKIVKNMTLNNITKDYDKAKEDLVQIKNFP
jgi:hypothetical protein